jgi:hypothetical protein
VQLGSTHTNTMPAKRCSAMVCLPKMGCGRAQNVNKIWSPTLAYTQHLNKELMQNPRYNACNHARIIVTKVMSNAAQAPMISA